MKAIIDGKRYDTETATVIAEWSNGYLYSDFAYCAETLYRTKKGTWFLNGEGGAHSRYGRSVGDRICGGSRIVPLSDAEAREWLESHRETAAIDAHFPVEEA